MKHLFVCKGLLLVLMIILIAGCAATKKHWVTTQSADTIAAYEEFLRQHPKSEFSDQAQSRLEDLFAQRDWKSAQTTNTIGDYKNFLRLHPKSEFSEQAQLCLENLYAKRDWAQAQSSDTIEEYKKFLRQHPMSEFSDQAQARLEYLIIQSDWEKTRTTDTIESYEFFLREHPESTFSNQALSRLELMKKDIKIWEKTQKDGSLKAYKNFITKNPQSPYAEKAKAIVADYESDIAGHEIVDALKKHKVEVQVTGSGIENVTMKIRRLVNHQVKVVVPVGTYFVCRGSAQNMVGREEEVIVLNDDEWQSEWISAACANRSRDIPDDAESFDIQASPHQDELKRLMPILQKTGASFGVEQAAVWIVTDNADYDDLGTLVERSVFQIYGGTRVIQEYEASMAMKLCDQAGIDITRKAIWRDASKILYGLENESLKLWLQGKLKK